MSKKRGSKKNVLDRSNTTHERIIRAYFSGSDSTHSACMNNSRDNGDPLYMIATPIWKCRTLLDVFNRTMMMMMIVTAPWWEKWSGTKDGFTTRARDHDKSDWREDAFRPCLLSFSHTRCLPYLVYTRQHPQLHWYLQQQLPVLLNQPPSFNNPSMVWATFGTMVSKRLSAKVYLIMIVAAPTSTIIMTWIPDCHGNNRPKRNNNVKMAF